MGPTHGNICVICGISGNSLSFVLTVLWFKHFLVLLVPKGRVGLDYTSPDCFSASIINVLLQFFKSTIYSNCFWNKCMYVFNDLKMKILLLFLGHYKLV